jgi:hypothetical protein
MMTDHNEVVMFSTGAKLTPGSAVGETHDGVAW